MEDGSTRGCKISQKVLKPTCGKKITEESYWWLLINYSYLYLTFANVLIKRCCGKKRNKKDLIVGNQFFLLFNMIVEYRKEFKDYRGIFLTQSKYLFIVI